MKYACGYCAASKQFSVKPLDDVLEINMQYIAATGKQSSATIFAIVGSISKGIKTCNQLLNDLIHSEMLENGALTIVVRNNEEELYAKRFAKKLLSEPVNCFEQTVSVHIFNRKKWSERIYNQHGLIVESVSLGEYAMPTEKIEKLWKRFRVVPDLPQKIGSTNNGWSPKSVNGGD